MSGQRLPAPIAVGEYVGEADARHDLAGSVHQRGESARKSGIPLDVRAHFREVIRAGFPVRDVRQHLTPSMQRAIDVGVFELVGHHAGDGVSVLAAEGRGPVLFEFDERGLGLRLIFGAIGGKRGRREGQQNSKQGSDFHVQIVT